MTSRHARFNPAAEAELQAAMDWYEERRDGLGGEFMSEVRKTVAEIVETPQRWRVNNGTRRAPVTRFPYSVVYREPNDAEIEVVAVAHVRRRPDYWAGR